MATTIKSDVTKALQKLDLTKNLVIQEAETLVLQAAQIGINAAKAKLDASITRSGIERISRGIGNTAGRNKTGEMINSIELLDISTTDTSVKIKFGWSNDSYFKFQEKGTSGARAIPAANSLLTGRRAVENELPRLERNMLQRIKRKIGK